METISRRLEDLLAFHAVATEGGFTAAATSLATSKAQLSKQVQRLEAHLGLELFKRSTRSVRLTDEGTTLLEYTRKIFALSEEAGKKLRELQSGEQGMIRISTTVSLGEVFFSSFQKELSEALPGVILSADVSNEIRDLQKDEIDFALRSHEEDENSDLVARYLGELRDVVICSPRVARKQGLLKAQDPRILATLECIPSASDDRWNNWTLSSKKEEIQVRVTGRVTTNQYTLVRRYALDGLGIARLPYYMVSDDLLQGKLVQLFPSYEIATHPLYLVYRKGGYTPKRIKIARDAIIAWFSKRPDIFLKNLEN